MHSRYGRQDECKERRAFQTRTQNSEDKIAISSYGKSSMISMVNSCSSSGGGGISSGGDKNNAIKSAAQFDGYGGADGNNSTVSGEMLKQIQFENNF